MKKILHSVLTILTITTLIVVHELGHWGAARALGFEAPVFSVGFGPKQCSLTIAKIWDTEFRLSPIPLGGYVSVPALNHDDEAHAETPALWRILVIEAAGVAANVLFAAFALFALLRFFPETASRLLEAKVDQATTLKAMMAGIAGSILSFLSGTRTLFLEFFIFWRAQPGVAITGPVGILKFGNESAGRGMGEFLLFTYTLAISLAALNVLPVPPLDGGHMLLSLLDSMFELSPTTLNTIGLVILWAVAVIFLTRRRYQKASETEGDEEKTRARKETKA